MVVPPDNDSLRPPATEADPDITFRNQQQAPVTTTSPIAPDLSNVPTTSPIAPGATTIPPILTTSTAPIPSTGTTNTQFTWSNNTVQPSSPIDTEPYKLVFLVNTRNAERSKSTSLINRWLELKEAGTATDPDDLAYVINKLRKSQESLNAVNSQLLTFGESNDGMHDEALDEAIFKAERFLQRLEASTTNDVQSQAGSQHSTSVDASRGLPKIPLPKFSGRYIDWRPFWDTFSSLIDRKPIPAVDKFIYLRQCLEPLAKRTIQGLTATAENYEEAKRKLKKRFGNPFHLIGIYAFQLLHLPVIKPGDVESFRDLVYQFQDSLHHILSLADEIRREQPEDDLDEEDSSKSPEQRTISLITSYLLAPILLRNLPSDVVLQWNRDHETDRYHLRRLMKFVEQELESREELQHGELNSGLIIPKNKMSSTSSGFRPSTGSALNVTQVVPSRGTASNSASSKSSSRSCECCNREAHLFKKCRQFMGMSTRDRASFITEKGRCTMCLGTHPRRKEPCSKASTVKCSDCGLPHHILLCPGKKTDSVMITLPATSSSLADTSICLKIARTRICSPFSSLGEDIYVYLDDGAQRSYIRSDLAQRLQLPVAQHQVLTTGSFGGNIHEQQSDQVRFRLTGPHSPGVLEFAAWTTSTLCCPIRQVQVDSIPPILQQFSPWADKYDGGVRNISIILGADCLSDVTTGFHRVPGFPTVVQTFFGSLFFGPFPGLPSAPTLTPSPGLWAVEPRIERLFDLESAGFEDHEFDSQYPDPVLEDGRYVVRLPFKGDRRPAPNRHLVAPRQARTLTSLPPAKKGVYENKLRELISDGICEQIPVVDEGFYLPHHCVNWERKPRVVFNGSASTPNGSSLNTCLDPGPNLLASLQDVLLRYRLKEVPVVADVKSAFHSLVLHTEDRKWVKYIHNGLDHQFCRVPFGLSSSPFLLHSTIIYHVQTLASEPLATELLRSIYCDDVVKSEDTTDDANTFREDATKLLASGGMVLVHVEQPSKILGLPYDSVHDTLSVKLNIDAPSSVTRRTLLSTVSKIFDPLGFISPFVLRGRLLLQESWKESTGKRWDDPLSESLRTKFEHWIAEVQGVKLFFPRWIRFSPDSEVHIFSDASAIAYAFSAYVVPKDGPPQLLFSKSRAAPLRPTLTIPRLELLAATLAARFAARLLADICTPQRLTLWCDSTCVLQWISNGVSGREIFVKNRLRQIAQHTAGLQWRYVPSALNPADIASRGASLADIGSLFNHGPEFITQSEDQWPNHPCHPPQLVVAPTDVEIVGGNDHPTFLDLSRCPSLRFATQVTSYVLRFIFNVRRKNVSERCQGPISATERSTAFNTLVKLDQARWYPEQPHETSLQRLHIERQHDVFVMVPRTGSRSLPLVHSKGQLAQLLVTSIHCELFHQGAESTLAELRQRVWIPRGRSLVRKLIHNCPGCRRFRSVPYQLPEASLQPFRRNPAPAFQHTGIDYFGPLYLQDGSKVWVLLCTCASTRALHLELVLSCSAEHTYQAVRRFLALRIRPFVPVTIRSDNAKTFLKLSAMRFPIHDITWKFIPVRSPSWGGWWERLVQTVKRSLRPILHGIRLSAEDLQSLLLETSSVVNQRPLTHVSADAQDLQAICPNDFLFAPREYNIDSFAVSSTAAELRRSLFLRDQANRSFWITWSKQYLASLAAWHRTKGSSRLPTVGDIVICQRPCPRGQWPLARILELYPGVDGVPRAARILLKGKTLTVATKLLYPLEANAVQPSATPVNPPQPGAIPNIQTTGDQQNGTTSSTAPPSVQTPGATPAVDPNTTHHPGAPPIVGPTVVQQPGAPATHSRYGRPLRRPVRFRD